MRVRAERSKFPMIAFCSVFRVRLTGSVINAKSWEKLRKNAGVMSSYTVGCSST